MKNGSSQTRISPESDETRDIALDLRFEGNYILSLVGRFKWLNEGNVIKISLFLFLVGWAIPGVLAYYTGVFLPGGICANKCFLFDLTMYAFYLLSLPIILNSEHHISTILNTVVEFAFRTRILSIPLNTLQHSIKRTNRRARSPILHIIALALAYGASIWWMRTLLSDNIDTWHAIGQSTFQTPSIAGLYVTLVSIPLGLYVIFVWTLKAILWISLVRDITRGEIRVNPLHVDRCGGLSFFSRASLAWGFLILAIGFVIVLDYANFVFIQEASAYRWDLLAKLGAYIAIAPSFFIGQLLFFTPHLVKAKMRCLNDLTEFGHRYSSVLHKQVLKFTKGELSPSELKPYVGGAADVERVFRAVKRMRLWPFDMGTLMRFLATVVLPLVPLMLPSLPNGIRTLMELFV